ncbi:MAG: hypothetical protein AB7C90_02510 [Bacteroidales bacterium]
MPRTPIDEVNYQLIKAHILTPAESPLNPEQQQMFNRILSAARVLDKNPVTKQAVALHMTKYPEIGRSRAYLDISIAKRLFNTIHEFDFDFWQTWLINDIVENIKRARTSSQPHSLRVIAMEHANLIKALGKKPDEVQDPRLTEQHQFYILIQNNNQEIKLDLSKLKDLPEGTLQDAVRELNTLLFSGREIDDSQADKLMKT